MGKHFLDGMWMVDAGLRALLDDYVKATLAKHRGLQTSKRGEAGAASISSLTQDLKADWDACRWYWVTVRVALLSELIFAARHGSVFEDPPAGRAVHLVTRRALRILRNVAFHPAHVLGNRSGPPHMEQLVEHLKANSEGRLGQDLENNWSLFGSKQVAAFALRMLDSGVRNSPELAEYFP
jgi:hypothetical protein